MHLWAIEFGFLNSTYSIQNLESIGINWWATWWATRVWKAQREKPKIGWNWNLVASFPVASFSLDSAWNLVASFSIDSACLAHFSLGGSVIPTCPSAAWTQIINMSIDYMHVKFERIDLDRIQNELEGVKLKMPMCSKRLRRHRKNSETARGVVLCWQRQIPCTKDSDS